NAVSIRVISGGHVGPFGVPALRLKPPRRIFRPQRKCIMEPADSPLLIAVFRGRAKGRSRWPAEELGRVRGRSTGQPVRAVASPATPAGRRAPRSEGTAPSVPGRQPA